LLNVKEKCSNVMPLHDYLQPRDKSTLCNVSATCVFLDLDTAAFGSGNIFNMEDAMDKLKKDICPHTDTPHLELRASPCSFVMLSDLDRLTVCACVCVCMIACWRARFKCMLLCPLSQCLAAISCAMTDSMHGCRLEFQRMPCSLASATLLVAPARWIHLQAAWIYWNPLYVPKVIR